MDLGDQAHRVKLMIRDSGSNFTAAFDAIHADAGIRTVLPVPKARGTRTSGHGPSGIVAILRSGPLRP
jgi:putative transposase